jgi:hypothetical protein
MGLSLRFFIAEEDGTLTRVPTAEYMRWFDRGQPLPPDWAGRELKLFEVVVKVERQQIEKALRILPVRQRVRRDGQLDKVAAIRLSLKRMKIIERTKKGEPGAAIEQLEVDANYFWAPTEDQLAALAAALFKQEPAQEQLAGLRAVLCTPGQALEDR